MKLFKTEQIRVLDALTIKNEPISSIELMNRAAQALFLKIQSLIEPNARLLVLAGPGNNGGDALALARLLLEAGYRVDTFLCQPDAKVSRDTLEQLIRLQQTEGAVIHALESPESLTLFHTNWNYLIDGLFGTGLNRPLTGYFSGIVHWMNCQNIKTISIDLPSGLFGEDNSNNLATHIVKANLTLGLQFPRLAYLLPENECYVGKWELLDIGIHPLAIEHTQTPYFYSQESDIAPILKVRSQYAHKGTFGRLLIVAGSSEMTGAALLSVKGALRSGAGLVCLHIPEEVIPVIQSAIPETIVHPAEAKELNLDSYAAIAIGPGIGNNSLQLDMLQKCLKDCTCPLVLDADALNFIAGNTQWMANIPKNSILTPHPKEMDRLTGKTAKTGYERLMNTLEFAQEHSVFVVLKGAYTACIEPNGRCSFNSTGNPGMATGGSGDVLTGIIVSLMAQGYEAAEACRLGVYLHGLSGDISLNKQSLESLIASDLAENLGLAFKTLKNSHLL